MQSKIQELKSQWREISLASRRFPLPQSPSQLLVSFNSILMLNTFVTILLLVTVIYFVWQNDSKIKAIT